MVFHIGLDREFLNVITSGNLNTGDSAALSVPEHLTKMACLAALTFSTKLSLLGCLLGLNLNVARGI
jgi:hypothetical protein